MPETPRGSVYLLKQQRLPAWQSILSHPCEALFFIAVSLVFTPLGALFFLADTQANDISVRYDQIHRCTRTHNMGAFTYEGNNMTFRTGCVTEASFTLSKTFRAPVYLYYALTDFYQTHRRYSHSRSDAQLSGRAVKDVSQTSPFAKPGEVSNTSNTPIRYNDSLALQYKDFVYVPAGLIAWSMFNDTFALFSDVDEADGTRTRKLICNGSDFSKKTNLPLGNSISENKCTKKGIAWGTDVSHKFKAPNLDSTDLLWTAARELYTSIPSTTPLSNDSFFNNGWYAGELGHAVPLTTDEDLMVWMRLSPLPSFRKLYRVIHTDLFPGKYVMVIHEHYDVSSFDGSKSFSLVTLSWLGGKSAYLTAMYFAIGGLSLIFGLLLLLVHRLVGDNAAKAIDKLL